MSALFEVIHAKAEKLVRFGPREKLHARAYGSQSLDHRVTMHEDSSLYWQRLLEQSQEPDQVGPNGNF